MLISFSCEQSLFQIGYFVVGRQLSALIDDQGVGLLQLDVEGVELSLERGVLALQDLKLRRQPR